MRPALEDTMVRNGECTRFGTRVAAVVVVGLAVVGLAGCKPLPPVPPGGTAANCRDVAWGSGQKAFARMATTPITGVRAGRHHCFDRLVIDLLGRVAPGWTVRYGPVESPGTGEAVTLRGGASIEIIARAPAYDAHGTTYEPAVPSEAAAVGGFTTFRQVAYVESFEGQTTFGIGVKARLPFQVFAVEGTSGSQLVVDVAHAWA